MRFPQFTIRRLMIAVAAVAVILGGYFWLTRPPSVELRVPTQSLRVSVDHEIFDVVLTHLLENKEFWHFSDDQEKQVVLDAKSEEGYPLDITDLRGKLKEVLSEKKIDSEIFLDIGDRNPKRVIFILKGYKPSNPNIVVQEIEHGYGEFPSRPWVSVLLPGYSKDGQHALLRFSFGPTPHGADGFYLLKKVNGHWEVVAWDLAYYM